MAAELLRSQVYRGPSFSLIDVQCCHGRSPVGAEEASKACDVTFVRRGVFVKHVCRARVIADCNTVVFFNRGEPYSASHPVDGGDECTVLALREDLLCEVLADADPAASRDAQPRFRHTHGPAEPACQLKLAKLRGQLRAPIHDPLAAEEAALELFSGVVTSACAVRGERPPRRADTAAAHLELSGAVQTLLAARFAEPLTLCEVADAVCSSPYHLARVFRREVGSSIHQYRARLRLAAALHRLAEGESDLTRLALESGFSSHSHFTTAFRQRFGVSPSVVRGRLTRPRLHEMSTILTA
ncbi:MAG: helix-turn-helix transcriptional regulator [Phycisphaerae bacterium]|jgi:AraC-like DNA-binding protein